jgi:hypothetical protein
VRHSTAGGFYAVTTSGVLLLMKPSLRGVDKSVNLQVGGRGCRRCRRCRRCRGCLLSAPGWHRGRQQGRCDGRGARRLPPPTAVRRRCSRTQVRAAFALAASSSVIACACAAGTVRMFALRTLAFVANLPRIAPKGQDQVQGGAGPPAGQLSAEIFPDALGCSFDASGKRLAVAYSDRSLHIWDVSNTAQVGPRRLLAPCTVAALVPPPWSGWADLTAALPCPPCPWPRSPPCASARSARTPPASGTSRRCPLRRRWPPAAPARPAPASSPPAPRTAASACGTSATRRPGA